MVYPHPVADAPFPPIMGKRSSPLCTAVRSCVAEHGFASQHQPSAQRRLGSGHCRTLRGCDLHFIPSQPPQGGAMNARAASVFRTTVSAGNPGHNITHYCETPRASGVTCKTGIKSRPSSQFRAFCLLRVSQQDVMLSASIGAS